MDGCSWNASRLRARAQERPGYNPLRSMAPSVAPPRVLNIEDLRRQARRRMPRVVFDYIDGGAERERTLGENCRAFDDILFRPRSAVATRQVDLATTVLGTPIDAAVHARAGRQQPPVLAARRGRSGAGGRRRGYRLHPVHALRLPAGRRAGGHGGAGLVSAVPRRRPQRRAIGHRPRKGGRIPRAGRHHRHAGRGTTRARLPQRHQGTALAAAAAGAALPSAAALAPALAGGLLRRRRPDAVPQHRPRRAARWPTPTSARRSKPRWCRGTTSRGFARPGAARSW